MTQTTEATNILDAAADACIALHNCPTLYNQLAAREAMEALAHSLSVLKDETGLDWRDLLFHGGDINGDENF